MNANEILQQQVSKTRKIEMLLALGLTRKEVATLVGVGYGFVQNVFAKCYPERVRSRRALEGPIAPFAFSFTRTFGIELELFGIERNLLVSELRAAGIAVEAEYYNHTTRAHWKIVNDGSVVGEHALELVSPVLQGEAGLAEVRTICGVLKRLGGRINKTTGFHAHSGMQDIGEDITVWRNLFHNYATLEPLIDSFMPVSRRASNNTYCRSMRVANFASKIERASDLHGLEQSITGANRYFKLNVQAFWRHNTAEFRQHAGTIEFEKIANWVLFTARLIEFSKTQRGAAGTFEELARFASPEMIAFFKSRAQQLRVAA